MNYIIISLKHGTGKSPMFWRANDAGYTSSPFAAGIYTEEQVKTNQDYYNNGYSAVAIPLTDAAMGEIDFNAISTKRPLKSSFSDQRCSDLQPNKSPGFAGASFKKIFNSIKSKLCQF